MGFQDRKRLDTREQSCLGIQLDARRVSSNSCSFAIK